VDITGGGDHGQHLNIIGSTPLGAPGAINTNVVASVSGATGASSATTSQEHAGAISATVRS
jgi:hypothetical protein